jgi:6,7-dimethyl-8-ribityllumazine synthase
MEPKQLLDNEVPDILFDGMFREFELIYGAKKMLQTQNVDAVIVGCVIQGETKHFDFVCEGVTQGIKDLNIQSDIPIFLCSQRIIQCNNQLIEVEDSW